MKLWQKCPICDGTGNVSGGYFTRAGDSPTWVSGNTIETCQTCNGMGVIKTPDQAESTREVSDG